MHLLPSTASRVKFVLCGHVQDRRHGSTILFFGSGWNAGRQRARACLTSGRTRLAEKRERGPEAVVGAAAGGVARPGANPNPPAASTAHIHHVSSMLPGWASPVKVHELQCALATQTCG